MSKMLEAALDYLDRGWSVLPVMPRDKRPLVPWEEFQKRYPTREGVTEWFQKWPTANVGIVTGKISNLSVIDVDDETGARLMDEEILSDTWLSPKASTPRGGYHLYCNYCNGIGNNARALPGIDLRSEGGFIIAPPSIGSNGTAYQWIIDPGQVVLSDLPEKYIERVEGGIGEGLDRIKKNSLYIEEGEERKDETLNDTKTYYNLLNEGTRDNDLFRIGMALADGHLPVWQISQVLEKLAYSCNPPFPKNELQAKIKSIFGRIEKKDRNLTEEVREFYLLQKGYINTKDLLNLLNITKKESKKHVTVIQNHLEKQGVIEKHGVIRGCYRPVEKKKERMEFIEGDISEFLVKFPFRIHDLCSLYPKNIVIIAGSKSSGKTAFLLNIALQNQDLFPVIYLNSEMGNEEWSKRLKLMGCKTKNDIRFEAIECSTHYQDQVGPEKAIYLIDFLEIHDNFFEIAKPIRLIHEKLKEGIAIIAVQKKFGERLGRGADFSMEKARLYLTLDYDKDRRCSVLKIEDAKAPRDLYNIRGYHKHIKIIGGSKMEALDKEWLL